MGHEFAREEETKHNCADRDSQKVCSLLDLLKMTIALTLEKFVQPQRRGRNIRAAQEDILKKSACYKIHCKECLRAEF